MIQCGASPSVYDKEKILMLPLRATGGKGVGVKYDRCREWVAAVFHHGVITEQSLGPGQRALDETCHPEATSTHSLQAPFLWSCNLPLGAVVMGMEDRPGQAGREEEQRF